MQDITKLIPNNFALVIIDLQKGYCDPNSDCAIKLDWDVSTADRVAHSHVAFLQNIRQHLPPERIIWLRMEEAEETYAENTRYGPHLKDKWMSLCVRGTKGHDFHVVSPHKGEPEFLKFHPSGFSNEKFVKYLSDNHITQLGFTGVIASRCVNATTIVASALGKECIIFEDLIAGPAHLEDEIREHMKNTCSFFALPYNSTEFVSKLNTLTL